MVLSAHLTLSENLTHNCDVPIHVHLIALCESSKAGHPYALPGGDAFPFIRVSVAVG